MEKNKVISVKNLVKSFDNDSGNQIIIDNLNVDIYKNDFTIIMGASGAGKSTLLYSLSGMDKPTSGSIVFNNKNITNMNADELAIFRRKNCGFVFQQIYMLDKMSLLDNVLTAGLLVNSDKKTVVSRAKKLFQKVNIKETTYKKTASQVSGGECQRAGIVRAVINNPSVLFADEPTGALDSKSAKQLLMTFDYLHQKLNATILMVTHDAFTASYADRIIFIKDGKIFNELVKGNDTRKQFFEKIIEVQTLLGGDLNDVI